MFTVKSDQIIDSILVQTTQSSSNIGHRFKVLLVQSHPPYKDKGGHKTWEATLSAWHVREAI
jgi:hypothetical protein